MTRGLPSSLLPAAVLARQGYAKNEQTARHLIDRQVVYTDGCLVIAA